jgi:hypothetical protein
VLLGLELLNYHFLILIAKAYYFCFLTFISHFFSYLILQQTLTYFLYYYLDYQYQYFIIFVYLIYCLFFKIQNLSYETIFYLFITFSQFDWSSLYHQLEFHKVVLELYSYQYFLIFGNLFFIFSILILYHISFK